MALRGLAARNSGQHLASMELGGTPTNQASLSMSPTRYARSVRAGLPYFRQAASPPSSWLRCGVGPARERGGAGGHRADRTIAIWPPPDEDLCHERGGADPKGVFADRHRSGLNHRGGGFKWPLGSIFHPLRRSLNNRLEDQGRMAESEGFEPSVRASVQRFSRPPRSTTPATLREQF